MPDVRVFFNDAAGGSFSEFSPEFAESHARRMSSELRDRPYLPMMHGFDPAKAVLVESMLSPMNVAAESDLEACEQVFSLLNADDRPNGSRERSLSVGDVLEVGGVFYECDNVGWVTIGHPNSLAALRKVVA